MGLQKDPLTGRKGDWILLNSGRRYWPLDPRPEDFVIEDIAHGLSHVCRWAGHVDNFYSVAQHSVIVSHNVPFNFAMDALLHDASEAYLGDVTRPLKRMMGGLYATIERRTEECIAKAFGLAKTMPPIVKSVDNRITVDERKQLFANNDDSFPWQFSADQAMGVRIHAYEPHRAKEMFLARYNELKGDSNE